MPAEFPFPSKYWVIRLLRGLIQGDLQMHLSVQHAHAPRHCLVRQSYVWIASQRAHGLQYFVCESLWAVFFITKGLGPLNMSVPF